MPEAARLNGDAPVTEEAVEDVAGDAADLRRQLLEKEEKIQEQHKALVTFRAVNNEQAATIDRLTAEVRSYQDVASELDEARERSRSIARFKTQIRELEETVTMRGQLIEKAVKRSENLQRERNSLQKQLEIMNATCDERLALIAEMTEEFEQRADDLRRERASLKSQIEILDAASNARLATIEEMTQEYEKRAEVLRKERNDLQSQIDVYKDASGERLATIEAMTKELEVLRFAAQERAEIIARLQTELAQSSIRQRIKRLLGGGSG